MSTFDGNLTAVPATGQAGTRAGSPRVNRRPGGVPKTLGAPAWGGLLTVLVVCAALATDDALWHWFILPTTVSGLLAAPDALRLFTGKYGLMDPRALVGAVAYHGFFVAPILHVRWDYWLPYVHAPADWRDWLGYLACLNIAGFLAYRAAVNVSRTPRRLVSWWQISQNKLKVALPVLLAAAVALQLVVYARLGGLAGLVSTVGAGGAESRLEGFGPLFVVSESFPLIFILGAFGVWSSTGVQPRRMRMTLLVITFLVLVLLFGGLRSSRSQTIWTLAIATGAYHLYFGPLKRRTVLAGFAIALAFLYLAGFYKSAGTEVFGLARHGGGFEELEEATGRTIGTTLLHDLARSDVQAYALYRLRVASDYEPPIGQTYVSAVGLLLPGDVVDRQFVDKVQAGTELLYGARPYAVGIRSSQVYGLAGEALLNFGPWSVPLAYGLLGLLVGRASAWVAALRGTDTRRLMLAPLLAVGCAVIFISDLGNVVFFAAKFATMPFLLCIFSSDRLSLKRPCEGRSVH